MPTPRVTRVDAADGESWTSVDRGIHTCEERPITTPVRQWPKGPILSRVDVKVVVRSASQRM